MKKKLSSFTALASPFFVLIACSQENDRAQSTRAWRIVPVEDRTLEDPVEGIVEGARGCTKSVEEVGVFSSQRDSAIYVEQKNPTRKPSEQFTCSSRQPPCK